MRIEEQQFLPVILPLALSRFVAITAMPDNTIPPALFISGVYDFSPMKLYRIVFPEFERKTMACNGKNHDWNIGLRENVRPKRSDSAGIFRQASDVIPHSTSQSGTPNVRINQIQCAIVEAWMSRWGCIRVTRKDNSLN
jgi:hypothetical protein